MTSCCWIRWGRARTAGGNGVALLDPGLRGGNGMDDGGEARWGCGKGRGHGEYDCNLPVDMIAAWHILKSLLS
jgi:hypothetical protein